MNAPNPDLKLKPGLTANITIYTLQKDGVLLVPSKALRFTPDGATAAMSDSSSRRSKTLWVETGSGNRAGRRDDRRNGRHLYRRGRTGPIRRGPGRHVGKFGNSGSGKGHMNGQSNPFMPCLPLQKKK